MAAPVRYHLNRAVVNSEQEYRAFNFFKSHTAPELATAMKSDFWHNLILQVSHYDSAIRHAVVAFGSLGERLHINGVLTSDIKEANQLHEFACFHYDKALKAVRRQLMSGTGNSVEFTLISCFLFICFEFLLGNDVGVLTHLRSGLNICRSAQNEMNLDSIGQVCLSSDPGDFRTNTSSLYHLLDWLAAVWLGREAFEPVDPENPEPYNPVPSQFSSIREANECLFEWIGRVYRLRRSSAFLNPLEIGRPAYQTARTQQKFFVGESARWLQNLESLLVNFGDQFVPEELHRITVLRINHQVMSIILGSVLEADEVRYYRALDSSFEQIVSLSATLLLPVNVMRNPVVFPTAKDIFSFCEGVIQSLYFVAVKCVNLTICRKAISLLETPPWREGAWESGSMMKIAKRKVSQLEKEGFYADAGAAITDCWPALGGKTNGPSQQNEESPQYLTFAVQSTIEPSAYHSNAVDV